MGYFDHIQQIQFEGKQSKHPFAFKHYNPDEVVLGKTMKEHLRFSGAYWHTMTGMGSDPFGAGTAIRPWDHRSGMDLAKDRVPIAFELFEKLQLPYYCFHDYDVAPESESLRETLKNIDTIVELLKQQMQQTGVKLLWNTANMFSHPRWAFGAATSNNADVFAHAAAKVKKGLDVAKELGAENYVFWGGREGYESLLYTDMKLELDNLARFFQMAVDYAKEIGYNGQFLIEPKPKEPTTHQYDFDATTSIAFLKTYGLDAHFKLNIEANHATLAGHTFEHELRVSRINGMLGSIDANQGDLLLGWDTDEFPTDLYSTTLAMYEILKNGGLGSGGVNFDAKLRRTSFEPEDLLLGHIAGMDTFARGLKAAARLIEDKALDSIIEDRYASYTQGIGADIVAGKANFKTLEAYALENDQIKNKSARLESIRAMLNEYIF